MPSLALVVVMTTLAHAQPSTFLYVYDDLGQLAKVIEEATGDCIVYEYDEVGNILEVKRETNCLAPPVVDDILPAADPNCFTVTGQNLLGSTVSTDVEGVTVTDVMTSETELNFCLSLTGRLCTLDTTATISTQFGSAEVPVTITDVTPLESGIPIFDSISVVGEKDQFCFELAAEERVRLQAVRTSGGVDPCLEVFTGSPAAPVPDGGNCASNQFNGSTAQLDFTLDAGTYFVLMGDTATNETGNYNLLLQVQPSVVPNLASGGTVTASSSFSADFGPERVIDGDIFTSWFTASGDTAPFLEIVLPATSTVSSINMFGNRESPDGFDFLSGRFELFNAADEVVFDSGIVALPAPDRDVEISVPDVSGVVRVRFTAETFESVDPGFAELQS